MQFIRSQGSYYLDEGNALWLVMLSHTKFWTDVTQLFIDLAVNVDLSNVFVRPHRYTLLMYASYKNCEPLVHALLIAGATDKRTPSLQHLTALDIAASLGHSELVSLFINKAVYEGGDVRKDEYFLYPLFAACLPNIHISEVKYFDAVLMGGRGGDVVRPCSDSVDTCMLHHLVMTHKLNIFQQDRYGMSFVDVLSCQTSSQQVKCSTCVNLALALASRALTKKRKSPHV
jgi:hypothetical protein